MLRRCKSKWLILNKKTPGFCNFYRPTIYCETIHRYSSLKIRYEIKLKGKSIYEKCFYNNKVIIEINKKYFRPSEVDYLCGDSNKARKYLQWKPKHSIDTLIDDMINLELNKLDK